MRFKGKACEIAGEKEVLGQRIAWIRIMEDGSFREVTSATTEITPIVVTSGNL